MGPALAADWRVIKASALVVLALMAGVAGAAAPTDTELLGHAADRAIDSLGRPDGYFGNPDVLIPLPGKLEKLRKALQALGASSQADALVLAMNRAAEAAVPESRTLIAAAIREMPVPDAQQLAAGGVDALTQQLRTTMSDRLIAGMLPIVGKATKGVKLAESYNDVAGKASVLGVVEQRDADLDGYVTRRTLEGLFRIMAKEEAALRAGK
jgi:hypothetical protein